MKYLILIQILLLGVFVKANDDFDPRAEIFVGNWTQEEFYVKFYPVGAVFNGDANGQIQTKYSFNKFEDDVLYRRGYSTNPLKYIIGLDGFALSHSNPTGFFKIPVYNNIPADWNNYLLLSHEATAHLNDENDGIFGYGYYRLEIYNSEFTYLATINIDWLDFRYQYRESGTIGATDLYLRIYNTNQILNTNSVKFEWDVCDGCEEPQEISVFGSTPLDTPGTIQVYKQYHYFDSNLSEWVGYNLYNEFPPLRGNSVSDNNYLTYPLDGRNLPSIYAIPQHPNSGEIRGNVSVVNNINTLTNLIDTITIISISNKSTFKIESSDTFNMITPSSPSGGYTNLIVQDSSFMLLRPSSKVIVSTPNKITLKSKGTIILNTDAVIHIKPGAMFCNEGGREYWDREEFSMKEVFIKASVTNFLIILCKTA